MGWEMERLDCTPKMIWVFLCIAWAFFHFEGMNNLDDGHGIGWLVAARGMQLDETNKVNDSETAAQRLHIIFLVTHVPSHGSVSRWTAYNEEPHV